MALLDSHAYRMGNWQSGLDDLLKSSQDNGGLKTFRLMQTDDDRSRFVFDRKLLANISWLKDYFTERCQTFHQKDAQRAAQHKEQGNKLFVAHQDKQALQSYTQSMQFAAGREKQTEDSGTDLGVAYGNRSAALFRLHNYQDCVTDIERALDAGAPKQSKPKLLVRQCLCYIRLGQKEKAVATKEALLNLQDSCDDKTARYLKGEMEKIKTQIESIPDNSNSNCHQPGTQCLADPAVPYGMNSVVVQATSAVEMKTSASQGRFLQATRDIKKGDTLIVERPFAAVLLPPHYGTHCLHCFVALPCNPVGCGRCSGVLYCSEECRDLSWSAYHHVECRYMDLLHSVGIAHLALRIVLTVGLPALQDFLEQRRTREGHASDAVPGVTEEGRYERNYLSVYDLMTHTDDMVTDDLFQYSLTANLLLAILIHCGWFSHPSQPEPGSDFEVNDDDLVAFLEGRLFQTADGGSGLSAKQVFSVGGALLRHVQQLVCNAHAITALRTTQVSQEHLVETQSQVRVATAIYPTASLMNHSCDPTIISSFQKDVLVVKSVKDVSRGGEIFNCYGPHSKRMKRAERQEVLKTQYFFHCHCEACSCDQEDTLLVQQGLRCPQCGGTIIPEQETVTCPSCQAAVDMSPVLALLGSADSLFNDGATHLQSGQHAKAEKSFRKCLEVRAKVMSSNNHDLGQVHDAIAQCLASTGRYAEAADHLAESVAVTEAIFGASSIETARELHKMAEVLIHAGRPHDALAAASRALDVGSVLYSEGDDWLQELLCLKTALSRIIADGDLV